MAKKRNPPAGDRRAPGKHVFADGFQNSRNCPCLQAAVEHLHRLGPRALHEFVIELTAAFGAGIVDRLDSYRRLDPAILRALGADRFPPRLAAVAGGRS